MWARYRKAKLILIPLLVSMATVLTTGEPKETLGWFLAMGIGAVLALGYVIEEIVWIVRNQGRPCANCGQAVRLKPFRLGIRCPHCGTAQ